MARRGENIYRRKDGRYEGRYIAGRKPDGRAKFGYVYGMQYADVKARLLEKKAKLLNQPGVQTGRRGITVEKWLRCWMDMVF